MTSTTCFLSSLGWQVSPSGWIWQLGSQLQSSWWGQRRGSLAKTGMDTGRPTPSFAAQTASVLRKNRSRMSRGAALQRWVHGWGSRMPWLQPACVACVMVCHLGHIDFSWPLPAMFDPGLQNPRRLLQGPASHLAMQPSEKAAAIPIYIRLLWEARWNTVANGTIYIYWLVVWNIFYFPIYWEESSQLTNIFQRCSNHQPVYIYIYIYIYIYLYRERYMYIEYASKQ